MFSVGLEQSSSNEDRIFVATKEIDLVHIHDKKFTIACIGKINLRLLI